MLRLQQAAGNQAIQRLRLSRFPQSQLTVGELGDSYEQEAERVAAEVAAPASGPALQLKCACGGTPGPDGECAACRAKRLALQRPAGHRGGVSHVPPAVGEVVSSSGHPLDPSSRGFFESRLGYDFSDVRIHSDAQAVETAQALDAQAYTIGHHIVFGEGQYTPQTAAGRRLLAHELAHVVQQGASGKQVQRRVVDDDRHVTCRPTRDGAVETLQTAEDAAIDLGEGAAAEIRLMLELFPLQRAFGETDAFRNFRDILWRRFHLDMNRRNDRETLMPILARRFELVAAWVRRGGARYICGPSGIEPPGECTTRPGVGIAWTATGDDRTQMCEAFWNESADDQAGTIVHEWLHRGFGFLGDCEAANFHNDVCYDTFARELAGTATPDFYSACCRPPDDPLPPLAGAP